MVLKNLCSLARRHFIFNFIHFSNDLPKRLCPKRHRCTPVDYYIYNANELSETITRLVVQFSKEAGFHKATRQISKEMSEFITGKKGHFLEDTVCLINL